MAVYQSNEVFVLFLLLVSGISWSHVSGADPQIVSESQTLHANIGDIVIFRCDVQNQGNHRVRWTYLNANRAISQNAEILPTSDRYGIIHPQGGMWNLYIMQVVEEDDGYYQCSMDGFPLAQTVNTLVVNSSKPEIPTDIPAVDFTACCVRQKVNASCLPVCNPSTLDLDEFDFAAHCEADLLKVLQCGTEISGDRNHIPCCHRRLVPDHCLNFCINNPPSLSALGDDYMTCVEKGNEIVQCMEEGRFLLPTSPRSVFHYSPSPYQLSVDWSTINVENVDTITGYRVFYKKDSETAFRSGPLVKETKYVWDNLTPGTRYNYYIQAINNYGSSLPSYVIHIRTRSEDGCTAMWGIARPPSTLYVSNVTSSTAQIEWKPSNQPHLVTYYRVRYAEENSESFTEVSAKNARALLLGLKPGHTYNVDVAAVSEHGISWPTPSKVFLTKTEGGFTDVDDSAVTAPPPKRFYRKNLI